MEILKIIFKQTSWQIIGKIITSFSSIVILGIIARNYGVQGTGVATLAVTYLNIFFLLADFGFNAHELKRFKSKNVNISIIWRKLFGVRLVWSIGLAIVAVVLLPFWPFAEKEFVQSILVGAIAIVASSIFITSNLLFQYKLKYEFSILSSVLGMLLNLALVCLFAFYKLPVPFILSAYAAGWLVIAFLSLLMLKVLHAAGLPLFDTRYMKNLFKNSWPIAVTLALNVVYFRADAFMVASFKGITDAGLYNVAYSIFQSALVLPTFIMNAYYPLMINSFKGIKIVGISLLTLSIIGTVLIFMMAPFLVQILAGNGFEGSVKSLQILSFGFPAYFVSALLMWMLVTKSFYKRMLMIYAAGLLFNLFLNWIYIPQSSFIAASWITVISEYLILILLAVSLLR